MERTASCACGQLNISVSGEPKVIATCSCSKCQRRTGSVFGVSSYFGNDQVLEISGESTIYKRTSDAGRGIEENFCPQCGSSVYWKPDFLENHTGIAVGCFVDSNFPEPQACVWNTTKHSWVSFPEHWASSDTQDFDRA
jgi:hypothetical protein